MVQTANRNKAESALGELLSGNKRYQQGALQKCVFNQQAFISGKSGQAPPAIVLSCSDSRVPPEMVLDQGLGDIFVIRVAGNVLDNNVLASMLYALTHLGSRLVVVMGHSKCGACNAAQGAYIQSQSGGGQSKGVDPVSQLLAPIIDTCGHLARNAGNTGGDLKNSIPVEAIVEQNSIATATSVFQALQQNLSGNEILGEIVVAAGKYDLDDGTVKVLHQLAA